MKTNIWKDCLNCDANCCVKIPNYTLFLTNAESDELGGHCKLPCKFLDKKGRCSIHDQRPIDCRLWPFDIEKKNNKFYWVYYNTDCPIPSKYSGADIELVFNKFEKEIIPKFENYIEAYNKHKLAAFNEIFGPAVVIREIRL